MSSNLTNIASVLGTYNSLPTSLVSSPLVTPLITGLSVKKTADKQSWADGNLTYTITVSNNATLAYQNPIITDILDPTQVTLVDGSVTINGTAATSEQYTYTAATGTLTVTIPNVSPAASSVVTFQVKKK